MKTEIISKKSMLKRVSFFKNLKSLPIQMDKSIPQEGKDIVYARELLSIIGLEDNTHNTPINQNAPIKGAAGITMTKDAITRSSLALYLVDDAVGFDDSDLAILENNKVDNYWLIINKIDLTDNPEPSVSYNTNKTIRISVLKKTGIDLLRQELSSALVPNDQTVGTARARHRMLLNNVTEHLYLSKKYNDNHQIDLVAEELRIAHQDMLRIKGGDINEDLLDKIFSEFCIGK